MSNDKNLLVKLTKPQMLLFEKVLREGAVLYGVAVIVFFIADAFSGGYYSWGGFARFFDSVYTAAFTLCLFLVFLPYVCVRWNIASYLTLRKQIMEEDSKEHSPR